MTGARVDARSEMRVNAAPYGASASPDQERRLFIGSYTEGVLEQGIYTLAFDETAARLRVVTQGGSAPNPSYLALRDNVLLAAHELPDAGRIGAYAIGEDGALTCLGACSSRGDAGTCFVEPHPNGRCAYGADYESGSISCCLLTADGRPCGGLPSIHHHGRGANPERQSSAHVHSMRFVPGTRVLAVVDLGMDAVTLYHAEESGMLVEPAADLVRVADESGPRMLAFHPHLRVAALVCELSCMVELFAFDASGLEWEHLGRHELPTGGLEGALAAHAEFSPDGQHFYASVRGSDRIALFDVDDFGGLHPQSDFPSGGQGPRHFTLSPDGHFMAVANQVSGEVAIFALNTTGELHEATRTTIPAASCVIWG